MSDRLFLVDGSGYIFRAFHALPPLSRSDGTPTGAVQGFTHMILKLLEDTGADYIAIIFDASRRSFRNTIYPDYKANRPDPPDELVPQFSLVRDAARALGIFCLEIEGFEADDLIATLTQQAREVGRQVTIVSSDKDLMQLLDDEDVLMLDPMKGRIIGPQDVRERFGVEPSQLRDLLALTGDSTDNIPGVPGIGVKTAAELLTIYGDLESLLAQAETIKQPKRRQNLIDYADRARLAHRLVALDCHAPVTVSFEDLHRASIKPERYRPFFIINEFRTLLTRLENTIGTKQQDDINAASIDLSSYELITERAALETWIADAKTCGCVAVDTETTSLDPMQAQLVGIALATAPGRACYIPLDHERSDLAQDPPCQLMPSEALNLLAPLLADPSILKIGQNIKYDMIVLARQHRVIVDPVDDSMLISYVRDGTRTGHGLNDLARRHLNHEPITYDEVTKTGRTRIPFAQVGLERARDYAAEDADLTLRLHALLKPELARVKRLTVYERIDRPLIPVLVAMQHNGIGIDQSVLRSLANDFSLKLAELEREIYSMAGHSFNLASPKQLGSVLLSDLGIHISGKTKGGDPTTAARMLESIRSTHPIIDEILEWRQLAKLKNTYADALINHIHPQTGRVHSSFSLTGTSTGRLSSRDPNLQNIPIRDAEGKKIRRAFIAEKGTALLSIDYSQMELRLAASLANITKLKTAFAEGVDIHAATARHIFGTGEENVSSEDRRRAKAINFGILYGMSAHGLATALDISHEAAQTYIQQYFHAMPEFAHWIDQTKEQARRKGYVKTAFGRIISIPNINSKEPNRRAAAERQSINAPIQGAAADIMRRAMAKLHHSLIRCRLGARLLLQVHDELLLEVPQAQMSETKDLAAQIMENAADPAVELAVPLKTEARYGAYWSDIH